VSAWKNSLEVLRDGLRSVCESRTDANSWTGVFEYELPRERGRRPDVVLLAERAVLVLEFKDDSAPLQSYVDQVAAYARDLGDYHAASHDRRVLPVLVLTRYWREAAESEGVAIVGPDSLAECLLDLTTEPAASPPLDPRVWLEADYAPLPSLINAARMIFEHEPLPQIRRAESAGIPWALKALSDAAHEAKEKGEFHLALVTGVPGAGKTLVGLQFVYETRFGEDAGERPAVLLSGNGPLVEVLKNLLRNRVFVQDVHGFLKRYGGDARRLPTEHIWVYDEAQRAWDEEQVKQKRPEGVSEPAEFLRIGERIGSWALMVGLIGTGQEIYVGEEGGLPLWSEAVNRSGVPWIVHCPAEIASVFTSSTVEVCGALNLDQTLRSHRADSVHAWVNRLLDGEIERAKELALRVSDQGFDLYVTRDVEVATDYARQRYEGEEDKRYGFLASSRAGRPMLCRHGIDTRASFYMKPAPWFNEPPGSPSSCCAFREVATEFQCQGLELDLPIVAWGDDLQWSDEVWASKAPRAGRNAKRRADDPHRLRLNAYRVLLTRGRDGVVVFVPPDEVLDRTHRVLLASGMQPLGEEALPMAVNGERRFGREPSRWPRLVAEPPGSGAPGQ
jgi:hypothetical protein